MLLHCRGHPVQHPVHNSSPSCWGCGKILRRAGASSQGTKIFSEPGNASYIKRASGSSSSVKFPFRRTMVFNALRFPVFIPYKFFGGHCPMPFTSFFMRRGSFQRHGITGPGQYSWCGLSGGGLVIDEFILKRALLKDGQAYAVTALVSPPLIIITRLWAARISSSAKSKAFALLFCCFKKSIAK